MRLILKSETIYISRRTIRIRTIRISTLTSILLLKRSTSADAIRYYFTRIISFINIYVAVASSRIS